MSDLDLTEAVQAALRTDVPRHVIVTAVTRAAPHIERQMRERIAADIRAINIRDFKAGDPNSTFPSAYEVRNRAEEIALTGRDPVAP